MALSDVTSSAYATIGIEAMESFAEEVRSIAGRPASPDLLRFLSLATHLGAATAKMKGVRPKAPAHWDSLFAALMISPEPICRFVRWRLEEELEARATALELSILPDPSRRALALSDSAERPAQHGEAGFFTPSARSQIRFASENYSSSTPFLSLGEFLEALILRPASGHEKRSEDIQPRLFNERIMQWRADSEFDAGQAVGAIGSHAARSGLIEALLPRTQQSRSGENESSVPLLAALVEEVAFRQTPENENLARLARNAFPSKSDVKVWRFRGALTLIMRADAIVQRLGDSEIDSQHLVVAALAPDIPQLPPLAVPPEELNEPAILKQIRSKVLDLIADIEAESGRVELWMDLLSGERLRRVSIVSDSSVGDDLLDFTRYARAIATVIADKDVVPPLAIGLFGPWGSGKSAMIAMVKAQLDEIEQRARRGRRIEFCSGIVKVDFNAWYYAESNLWASLFQKIIEQTTRYLRGEKEDEAAKERAVQQTLLEVNRQEEAKKRAHAAELRRQANSIDEVSDQRNESILKNLQQLRRFADDFIRSDPPMLGESERETFDKVKAFVRELSEKTEHIQKQGKYFWAIGRIWGQKGRFLRISFLACLVLILILVSLRLTGHLTPLINHIEVWLTILGSLTIFGVPLLVAVRGGVKALDWSVDVMGRLEKQFEELESKESATEGLTTRHKILQEAAQLETEAAAAAERAAEAETRIAALNPRKLLAEYLSDKAKSYEEFLGLPTRIRRDIEDLQRYLPQVREAVAAEQRRIGNNDDKAIDRIVLFVDDLDRCRPEVVVRVLEAIHILLTFDLFEVVVGVDVRWLRRALDRYHAGQFGEGGPLDPLEYLEKIFQVPFWIPTMTEGGRRSIVESALPKAMESLRSNLLNEANTKEDQNINESERINISVKKTNVERENLQSITLPLPPLEPFAMVTEERDCVLHIGNLAGDTPRRLKRFARSYLILRASLSPEQQAAYVEDKGWSVVAWMMAIGCALPQHWGSFTDAIRWQSNDDDPFADWMDLPGAIIDAHRAALFAVQKKCGTRDSWPDRALCQKWLSEVSRFGFSPPEE